MPKPISRLQRLHARLVAGVWPARLAGAARVLLALAFLPSGLTKLLDLPFTALPADTPVGSFFHAFFQAHAYYRFVGAAQLLAAGLLLFPSTAALGAAIYLPIILNIFVITVAVGFRGTPFITGLMLLANLYLLAWDFDRWMTILPGARAELPGVRGRHFRAVPTLLLTGTAILAFSGLVWMHRAWTTHAGLAAPATLVLLGAAAGLLILARAGPRQRATQADVD